MFHFSHHLATATADSESGVNYYATLALGGCIKLHFFSPTVRLQFGNYYHPALRKGRRKMTAREREREGMLLRAFRRCQPTVAKWSSRVTGRRGEHAFAPNQSIEWYADRSPFYLPFTHVLPVSSCVCLCVCFICFSSPFPTPGRRTVKAVLLNQTQCNSPAVKKDIFL